MHTQKTLFDHQDALGDDDLRRYAEQLSLDIEAFDEALRTDRFHSRVQEDTRSGLEGGVDKTPVFFLNGTRYDGPLRLTGLRAAVERAEADAEGE